MEALVPLGPEDFEALGHQMRLANTGRIKAVLDSLEPYIDGSLGAVSPAHVNAYLKAVRELGQLWHAYDPPAPKPAQTGVDEEVMVLSARQESVLAELGKLREIAVRRSGKAA